MANDVHSNELLLEPQMNDAEVAVNRLSSVISGLCQISLIAGITTNTNSPSSSNDGDRFVVGTSPSGLFLPAGNAGKIASAYGGLFTFSTPQNGWIAWDRSSDKFYRYKGSSWIEIGISRNLRSAASIMSPAANNEAYMGFTEVAITVTRLNAVWRFGTTPSATWNIRHATSRNSGSPNNVMSANQTTTSQAAGDSITTFGGGDPTIPANSHWWLFLSAVSGTVTGAMFEVAMKYTEDG